MDAEVAGSRTLEVIDGPEVVDHFGHHSTAVAALSTNFQTTDTGRFESEIEDHRLEILVDNPSELNVASTECTRPSLGLMGLNWGYEEGRLTMDLFGTEQTRGTPLSVIRTQ